jgi:tetratricopeptide (TPR) repeat protein
MALAEYQKALKTRPNWDELHLGIGRVLLDEGLLQEARKSFREFFSLSPKSLSGTYWDPFTVSSWLREWDVATKEVDEYIARRPDDPYGYQTKANILINGFGDLKGAQTILEEGMKLPLNQYRSADYAITTDNFWVVSYYQGKYRDALACLVEFPGEFVFRRWERWMRKGQTYVALNQYESGMACFDSALSCAERYPAGFWTQVKLFHAGLAHAWQGKYEKAAMELENASKYEGFWHHKKGVEEAQALLALFTGDNERALNLIEQLISQPGILTVWKLRLDPVYEPLRSSPRFQALLTKNK